VKSLTKAGVPSPSAVDGAGHASHDDRPILYHCRFALLSLPMGWAAGRALTAAARGCPSQLGGPKTASRRPSTHSCDADATMAGCRGLLIDDACLHAACLWVQGHSSPLAGGAVGVHTNQQGDADAGRPHKATAEAARRGGLLGECASRASTAAATGCRSQLGGPRQPLGGPQRTAATPTRPWLGAGGCSRDDACLHAACLWDRVTLARWQAARVRGAHKPAGGRRRGKAADSYCRSRTTGWAAGRVRVACFDCSGKGVP